MHLPRRAGLAAATLVVFLFASWFLPPAAADSPGLTSVRVSPSTVVLVPGMTAHLTATALDERGQAVSGASFAWRMEDRGASVATLDASGASVTVTAGGVGSTSVTVTATSDGTTVTGLANIAVYPEQVANQTAHYPRDGLLVFPADSLGLAPGQEIEFAASAFRAGRYVQGAQVEWSILWSFGDAGSFVSGSRFVAGVGGMAAILAKTGSGPDELRGAAFVSVRAPGAWSPLPQVVVSPGIVAMMKAGQTMDFEASLFVGGQPVAATFTWSAPISVWEPGSTDAGTGLFTSERAGVQIIQATAMHQGREVSSYAIVTVAWGVPTLYGRVTNADGVAIQGAKVEVGGSVGPVATDAHGSYAAALSTTGGKTTIAATTSSGDSSTLEATPSESESENRYDIVVAARIASPSGGAQALPWTLLGLGIVIAAAVGAALLLGGEVAIVAFLFLIMPMYARIKAEKMLDHFVRGRIFGLIQAQPGLSYSDLRRLTGVGNGTLGYHLWCLEKTEYIFSRREGKLKAYYPKGFNAPDRGRMLSDPQSRIMEVVRREPGVSQSEVARALGTTRQHVNFNVKHMERLGVMRVVREGGEAHCHPVEEAAPGPSPARVPDRPPGVAAAPSPAPERPSQ